MGFKMAALRLVRSLHGKGITRLDFVHLSALIS